jgi:hypothetical protein
MRKLEGSGRYEEPDRKLKIILKWFVKKLGRR